MKVCLLDFETFSKAPIGSVGAFEYSKHPSTEILCVAYRVGEFEKIHLAETQYWTPKPDRGNFGDLLAALRDPSIRLIAHNSFFEFCIVRNVLGPKYMASKPELQTIPLVRWACTAALARSRGLPGNLEDACKLLGTEFQKDKEGHRLMLKLSKPRKATKHDSSERHELAPDLARLVSYCKTDVDAMVGILKTLEPHTLWEREMWLMDQAMNLRGFEVDRKLCANAVKMISGFEKKLLEDIREVTKGRVQTANQTAKLLKFIRENGVKLPNLQLQTVEETLKRKDLPPKARRVLQIRRSLNRAATKKFKAFIERSNHDGRARDNTIAFGAHTGRQAGTGLQPQNLFKSVLSKEDTETAIGLILRKDQTLLEMLFSEPLDVYASVIRSAIVSAKGYELDVADYVGVELRGLFWLADHKKGLKALIDNEDLYIEMASVIFNVPVKEIKKGIARGCDKAKFKRNVGKQCVLGAGYGMGLDGEKFLLTCKKFGIEVDLETASRAIHAYRDLHAPIPVLWGKLERCAIEAVRNPKNQYSTNHTTWRMKGKFLLCELPSGRCLHYFKPKLEVRNTLYGPKASLSYIGRGLNKKPLRLYTFGGKLTENVVQAICADLLFTALVSMEKQEGQKPILAVHDEIVIERQKHVRGSLVDVMQSVPAWAKGFPIKVEAWSGDRYRK